MYIFLVFGSTTVLIIKLREMGPTRRSDQNGRTAEVEKNVYLPRIINNSNNNNIIFFG